MSAPQAPWRATRALGVLTSLLLLAPAAAQPPAADEDKVDAFLGELRLFELQAIYLEREVARASDKKKPFYAQRLADVYVLQLLTLTDPAKVEELHRRIVVLEKVAPQVRTPALQVLLLQGEYNRAEKLVTAWVGDPDRAAERDKARPLFERLVPELDDLEGKMHKEYRAESEAADKLPDGPAKEKKDKEVARLGQVAGRASYLAGWSNFYLGLCRQAGRSAAEFRRARESFARLLVDRLEEGTDAEALELGIEPRAHAALGMALAEIANDNAAAARAWYRLLRDPAAHAQVRDRAAFWVAWGFLQFGQPAAAKQLAEAEVALFADNPSDGRVLLCTLLVRAGFGDQKAARADLGLLGLRGLSAMKRTDLARRLVEKYGVDLSDQAGFVMQWLAGQGRFEKAEKSKSADDYRAALKHFANALGSPDAGRDRTLAAQARYFLGFCYFRLNDLDRAAEAFQQAADQFRTAKSESAADAAWMLANIHLSRAPRDAKAREAAADALTAFRKEFKDHPNAKKVDFLLLRLRPEGLSLDKLDPKDASYPEAVLFAARQQHGRWKRATAVPAKAAALAADVASAADRYLELPAARQKDEGRLEALLIKADLALHARTPDPKGAGALLGRADLLAAALPADDKLADDYHYLKLLLAQASQDTEAARAEALWLAQNRKGTPYAQAGLVTLAKMVDGAVQQANDKEKPARRAEALKVYAQLVAAFGDDAATLKANKNALIASSRLGSYALDAGQYDLAAKQYDKLLQAYPKDARYLRGAALGHYHVGNYERAMDCWGPLVTGLPKTSPGWFEAKYHYTAALARTDPRGARTALDQFKLLYPDLGPEPWRQHFRKLEKTLPP